MRQARTHRGRLVTVILPEGMDELESLSAVHHMDSVSEEIEESTSFGEERCGYATVEMPMKSTGRMTFLVVPDNMVPEEMAEVREDMMSLCQPSVLEDAIAEAIAVEAEPPGTFDIVNLPLRGQEQPDELRVRERVHPGETDDLDGLRGLVPVRQAQGHGRHETGSVAALVTGGQHPSPLA